MNIRNLSDSLLRSEIINPANKSKGAKKSILARRIAPPLLFLTAAFMCVRSSTGAPFQFETTGQPFYRAL